MTPQALGRPLEEALESRRRAGLPPPRVTLTVAPARPGEAERPGTLRVVACRGDEWIAARFWDGAPRGGENA